MAITLIISGKTPKEVSVPDSATVADLKKEFAKVAGKSIHRISFKVDDKTRLDDDSKSISSYGLASGATVLFKDLGPQIGYRTVFLGPSIQS